MTPGDVLARLEGLEPVTLQAVGLVLEFNQADVIDVADFTDRKAEIEDAISELQKHTRKTRGIRRRCQQLQPVPTRHLPPGF